MENKLTSKVENIHRCIAVVILGIFKEQAGVIHWKFIVNYL